MNTARSVAERIGYDPGKAYFPPNLFAPSDPSGIIGNTTAAQPGPLRDRGREILGQAFVPVTVGERRQIGAVLLQDSAGEEDDGSLPVEHANLIDIQLGESVDLGLSRA